MGLEDARLHVKELEKKQSPDEISINSEDLKNALVENPDLLDKQTWAALAVKCGVVKEIVNPGADDRGGVASRYGDGELGDELAGAGDGQEKDGQEKDGQAREHGGGTGGEVFKCKVSLRCKRKFKTKGGLAAHIKEHHEGEKNVMCTTCGKRFTTSRQLKKHDKIHLKPPIVCEVCGVEKRDLYRLNLHKSMDKGVGHARSAMFILEHGKP